LKGEIEFKNVTFYYPTRPEAKVLESLSTRFELGKTTAIVGPSGAGKSSIALMIERFYEPSEGEVLIDGKPLKSLNLKHYRN
jgi:ABC-type multidrug transport system fused ATPase/permease subunit